MNNTLFNYFVYSTLLLTNIVIQFGCHFKVVAHKSNDIRNYLGTRTPYRLKYNKDDSKIKFASTYKLLLEQ